MRCCTCAVRGAAALAAATAAAVAVDQWCVGVGGVALLCVVKMGAHGPKRRKSCCQPEEKELLPACCQPERGWSLVVWLLFAFYWFGFLGFVVATDEPSMVVDLATASPALAAGVPVVAAAVSCSVPTWIHSWVAGFMADYRKQFARDGRTNNGGGHPKDNRRSYDVERQAMWITAVDELVVAGDPTPKGMKLQASCGLWSHERAEPRTAWDCQQRRCNVP